MADSFAQVPLPQPDFFFRCYIQCLSDDLRRVPGTFEIRGKKPDWLVLQFFFQMEGDALGLCGAQFS